MLRLSYISRESINRHGVFGNHWMVTALWHQLFPWKERGISLTTGENTKYNKFPFSVMIFSKVRLNFTLASIFEYAYFGSVYNDIPLIFPDYDILK